MTDKLIGSEKNILFYNAEDGNTQVEVLLEKIWDLLHGKILLVVKY